MKKFFWLLPLLIIALFYTAPTRATALPDPIHDEALAAAHGQQTAILAGGCFWGVDAVFKHVKGVTQVISGYAGGVADTAGYEAVSTGTTGHAEAVKITYDPAIISYGQLLKVYFSITHDPTTLNRQGPDSGTQYRSAIFAVTPAQSQIANDYIAQLNTAKIFAKPLVTTVTPLPAFYPAEDYHQNYLALHPGNPYIVINDAPKLVALKQNFPSLYVSQ